MAKKAKKNGQNAHSAVSHETSVISFPKLSLKHDIPCHVLVDDQIMILNDIFSVGECKEFSEYIENLPLELTPPHKRGEAVRVNYRYSIESVDFARQLHTLFLPHFPSFTDNRTRNPEGNAFRRLPHSMNPNIRLYKYTQGQQFGPHYDESIQDPRTGKRSEWTLLIYLSGVEDGVEGGETLFYKSENVIIVPLVRGSALLHRHGHQCMLHEGSPVRKGVKYVLRSDLLF